jgi:hypothetical protein
MFSTSRRSYYQGDNLLLYNNLPNYNRSRVLNENSVDLAIHNFTASVSEAMKLFPL